MPKGSEFVRFNTVKDYVNKTLKMRSSDSAVKALIRRLDTAVVHILRDARAVAKADKRNTIMDQDMFFALEKHLAKRHLTWQETVEEILRQLPTDLGKISRAIRKQIQKSQKNEPRTTDQRHRQAVLSHAG